LSKKTELKLLRPRLVPLSAEREREAVALLAELLLAVARKYGAGVSGGVLDGGSDGATGGVVSLPAKAGKARKAA
jgi:hypothetical protein